MLCQCQELTSLRSHAKWNPGSLNPYRSRRLTSPTSYGCLAVLRFMVGASPLSFSLPQPVESPKDGSGRKRTTIERMPFQVRMQRLVSSGKTRYDRREPAIQKMVGMLFFRRRNRSIPSEKRNRRAKFLEGKTERKRYEIPNPDGA